MKQQLILWWKRQMAKLNLPLSTEYTDPNELIVPEPSGMYEQYFINFIGIEGRDEGYVRSTPLLRPLLFEQFGTDLPSEIRFELQYTEARGYQLIARHDFQRYLLVDFADETLPQWFGYYDDLYNDHAERERKNWTDHAERFPDDVKVFNERHDPKGTQPWDDEGQLSDGTHIAELGSQTYIVDPDTDEALTYGYHSITVVQPGVLYVGKNGTLETLFKIAS